MDGTEDAQVTLSRTLGASEAVKDTQHELPVTRKHGVPYAQGTRASQGPGVQEGE